MDWHNFKALRKSLPIGALFEDFERRGRLCPVIRNGAIVWAERERVTDVDLDAIRCAIAMNQTAAEREARQVAEAASEREARDLIRRVGSRA